ncbi:MAG: branched-chain amino acid ABC transporter permease [Salinirussus sp.]
MLRSATLQVGLGQLFGITIDGVAFGLLLALLGVGITLVFGLGEVLNLAIGTFAVIGGLAASTLANAGGLDPALAAVGGVLVVGILGVVVDRTLLSLVYRSEGEERILLGIFVTLGLTIFLDGILFNVYPGSYSLPIQFSVVRLGETPISPSSLIAIAASLLTFLALFLFLQRTFLGRATRTVFQDEVGALLVGVDPRRIRSLVFVLSSLVAGLAGVLFAIGSPLGVSDGFEFTTFALIVSIVGGVRSVRGAVVAGLSLGMVIQYANFFVGSFVANLILFTAAVIALLVRPEVLS